MITKNKKKFSAYLILFLSISFINWPSIAEEGPMNPTQEVRPDSIIGHGTIEGIDAEKHQLTIKHDPIKALDWPGMTMPFAVARKVDMSQLKIGAIIDFQLEKDNTNQLQITGFKNN
ncbi:MAG: copper-binding protein [Alphaproteobacteria bacterium]|nr:copper-binding protein [Alphaproteobacteria bacterium]